MRTPSLRLIAIAALCAPILAQAQQPGPEAGSRLDERQKVWRIEATGLGG